MAKVQKSLRIDADTAARVEAAKDAGESMAAAYNRVLRAGLDAMDASGREDGGEGAHDGEAVRAMAATLDILTAQLEEKDAQIRTLSEIVTRAQQLQGAAPKALESSEQKTTRRGLFSRLFR